MKNNISLKNLRHWQPGQSGNPGGRPKLPDSLIGIKSLTPLEVNRTISKYARMTRAELDVSANEKLCALDLAIISVFNKSIKYGDYLRLAFLLDRCIGRVTEMVEDDEVREEREKLGKMSMNELLTLVKDNLPDTPEVIK